MGQDATALRKEFSKLNDRGLSRDVLNFYEGKLLPISDSQSGKDLRVAINNLQSLNALAEFDGLVERSVAAHPDNAALLTTAAKDYRHVPHAGRLIAGEFERDGRMRLGMPRFGGIHPRGRPGGPNAVPEASAGASVDTTYRDHIRSLQLFRQALAQARDDAERAGIWSELAQVFRDDASWKLQTLTPIETLPEWGEPGPEGGTEGAPWAKDGPVLYQIPTSW
jgi:hypothetical protein